MNDNNDENGDMISKLGTGMDLTIKHKLRLSYDGKQFLMRLPKEVSDFYNLKKGDQLELEVPISPEDDIKNKREIPMNIKILGNEDD